MDMIANSFKRALRHGDLQTGLWSHLSNHVSAEVIGGAGFDFIVLDAEHSPNETFLLHQQLQPKQPIPQPRRRCASRLAPRW